MKNSKKTLFIAFILIIALAFGLIFLTVGLTGSRDISDFTSRDWRIFIVFIAAEVVCFIIMFIVAGRLGRLNAPVSSAGDEDGSPAPSAAEKIFKRRGGLLIAAAIIVGLISIVIGIELASDTADGAGALLGFFLLIPVVLLVINLFARRAFVKKCSRLNVAEVQNNMLSARESAEATAEAQLKKLSVLRIGGDICAVLMFLSGVLAAAFITAGSKTSLFMVYIFVVLITALTRIRFGAPKKLTQEAPHRMSRDEDPIIYGLAEKARDEMGCIGEVMICVQGGCNVTIYDYESLYIIELGVRALSLWTEQELYAVLLHEFAHFAPNNSTKDTKEARICNRLNNGVALHFLRIVYDIMFSFYNEAYNFEYFIYSYAVSLKKESDADMAMLKAGKEAAASALLKLAYCNLYNYETAFSSSTNIYASAEPAEGFTMCEIEKQKEHMEKRREVWNGYIKNEILARSATHPTTAMRLEALGVEEYSTLKAETEGEYAGEVKRFAAAWDALLFADRKQFDRMRRLCYLDPLNNINEWVKAGKPLDGEKYRDILDDLEKLGDSEEMLSLCDRAIEELSDSASPEAYYRKGLYLLHNFDESGLDYVYHAVDANHNYTEKGLAEIGSFCCFIGNQAQLDIYRQRALSFAQNEADGGNEMNYLRRGDKLSAEQLPEGMLEADLARIAALDPRKLIFEIYLVRKTVNEKLSTSVYVIRFCRGVKDDDKWEVMHGIFNYLDTVSDWQYSLFDYDEVRSARVQNIDGALVYEKADATEK